LRLSAYVDLACGRTRAARRSAERAIGIARYLSDERLEAQLLRLHCLILFWGPAPLDEVVIAIERTLARARERGMRVVEAAALSTLARVAAMRGEFEQARSLNEGARGIATEFDGMTWAAGFVSEGLIELLAGDLEVAEKKLRHAYERTTRAGGTGPAASLAALLARTHLEQGRDDDALAMAKACRKMSSKAQLDMRLKPRSVRAVVLARNGRLGAAERLARWVVAVAESSEQIDTQVDARYALARVLAMAGRLPQAREAAEEALERCRAKGNKVSAKTIGAFLDSLGETSAA
jgi:ATP/maltotriose-dependent transcriptional regulator MalT